MNNIDIRARAKEKGVYLWQIADVLQIHDTNFSKMMRHELTDKEKEKIMNIIDSIGKEKTISE